RASRCVVGPAYPNSPLGEMWTTLQLPDIGAGRGQACGGGGKRFSELAALTGSGEGDPRFAEREGLRGLTERATLDVRGGRPGRVRRERRPAVRGGRGDPRSAQGAGERRAGADRG